MSSNPTNPVLGADHKPALGQTRGQDGNLEWFDSHTGTWRPAVRQHTIRNRLIRESGRAGSYTYQRDGKGADVASFLPKDRDFGTAWAHRPPIVFQLYPGNNRVAVKPQGVLMDGGRVMLDPYDHPIRDFPELPVTLSSKEKGMWIEYYMRQNREIKPYDLMARMGKSVNGHAVRIYTLNERATKFRNTAACLSWGEKTGSAEKKAYILGLLPEGATDTRSLGKDLTKKQQEDLVAANKGQFPNRRRKAKRTLEAQAPMAVQVPGFQPGGPSVDDDAQGESDPGIAPSQLEVQDSQPTDINTPVNFNNSSSLGYGDQFGAPQYMLGQDPNASLSAGGANYNGYHNTYDASSSANFLAPSQPYPAQSILGNFGGIPSYDPSYYGRSPTDVHGMNFFNPAQYGAGYGGQVMGRHLPVGGAPAHPSMQAQGHSQHDEPVDAPTQRRKRRRAAPVEDEANSMQAQWDSQPNHPVSAPTQRRKRARAAPAEDETKSSNNQRSKRARTEAPAEVPQEASSPEVFPGGEESLLRFDKDGFVITNNTPGSQALVEPLYPADFDEFLRNTQHGELDAEGEDVEETCDAPVVQSANHELLSTPAAPPAQGQKRRRSSSPENAEDLKEEPKSKRLHTEGDVETPAESTTDRSEEVEPTPVNVSRGQKRGRGSESREDTEADTESPPAKRSKMSPSADSSTTSDENKSSTTGGGSSDDDDASESSHHSSSSDDSDDGSEYTPSPYYQTSLKTISRPTTGGKGPYGSDGRPLTSRKGKRPLKSSRRANIARKGPAKQG